MSWQPGVQCFKEEAVGSCVRATDRTGRMGLRTDHWSQQPGGHDLNDYQQKKSLTLLPGSASYSFFVNFAISTPSQILPTPGPWQHLLSESVNGTPCFNGVHSRRCRRGSHSSAPDSSPSRHSLAHSKLQRKRANSAFFTDFCCTVWPKVSLGGSVTGTDKQTCRRQMGGARAGVAGPSDGFWGFPVLFEVVSNSQECQIHLCSNLNLKYI